MHGSTGGSWKRSELATATEVGQPDGKPRAPRLRDLPPTTATAPAPDPTRGARALLWAIDLVCSRLEIRFAGRRIARWSPGWCRIPRSGGVFCCGPGVGVVEVR